MQTTSVVRGLRCTACDVAADVTAPRCPECGGILTIEYDPSGVRSAEDCDPIPTTERVSLGAGATPLLSVPALADELGVSEVAIKDEGANPTGSLGDRKFERAVAAARMQGTERVGTPSTGNGAQSMAAHAARAGIDSTGFVPSRCPFLNKAMVNVHGGDMSVVEGRYTDAVEAFEASDETFHSLAPGHPFRIAGATALALELLADREWNVPDAVVHPTGHGETLRGLHHGFTLAASASIVDTVPRLYAAQPADAAPIADGITAGVNDPKTVEHPDTIVGPLEIPAPAVGAAAIDAVTETSGTGIAVPDKQILKGAVDGCEMGPEIGATGGTAVAGVRALADQFDATAELVLINPVAGSKEADILRSHLMSRGL